VDVLTPLIPRRSAKRGADLILRSDAQHRVSKDDPVREMSGGSGSVLRDAALRAALRTKSDGYTNTQTR
jgi:hypothetical protein